MDSLRIKWEATFFNDAIEMCTAQCTCHASFMISFFCLRSLNSITGEYFEYTLCSDYYSCSRREGFTLFFLKNLYNSWSIQQHLLSMFVTNFKISLVNFYDFPMQYIMEYSIYHRLGFIKKKPTKKTECIFWKFL